MLFEICQGFLMWEDFKFRAISPSVCLIAIVFAIFSGGGFVVLTSLSSSVLFLCPAMKNKIGFIDTTFLGVYTGLLADISLASYFYLLTGGLGILWVLFKKTSIPMITMMGISYFLIVFINNIKST